MNGSIFSNNCLFNKNGIGNDFSSGANVFNVLLTIINGSSGCLILGGNQADIFNQDVSINNIESNLIHPAYNSLGNQFNGKIILFSINGQGNRFGESNGRSILAASKTASLTNSFSFGQLLFRNCIQIGNQTQQIQLTNTATFIITMPVGGSKF